MSIAMRRKIDLSFERRFLIGLIVSDRFIREVQPIYRKEFLSSKPAVTIATWCFKFFEQYEKAPGRHIQDLFESEESKMDEELTSFIETQLQNLSEEYERADKFNVDFLLDETEKYFKAKSLLQLSAAIREKVGTDDVLGAEVVLSQYNIVSRPKSNWINPFVDEEVMKAAFADIEAPLFRFPGALGEMINPQLTREAFIALLAPEKRGKSFWLMEFAIQALRSRCNVVVFETGDMTENQYAARIGARIAGRPLPRYIRKGESIRVPFLNCTHHLDNSCTKTKRADKSKPCSACKQISPIVQYEDKVIEPLTWQEALASTKAFIERVRGVNRFRFQSYPNSTVRVKDLDNQLEIWKNNDGFVPDVIIIDYADICAPEDNRQDSRHQENDRWKALRRMSQKWKSCVITATQADANSYSRNTISMENFSEDKRKHAHVTAEYALNQSKEERAAGIMRIGEVVVRDGGAGVLRQVAVLECRQIGRCYLASYFPFRDGSGRYQEE